jgi:hypothetical protein
VKITDFAAGVQAVSSVNPYRELLNEKRSHTRCWEMSILMSSLSGWLY